MSASAEATLSNNCPRSRRGSSALLGMTGQQPGQCGELVDQGVRDLGFVGGQPSEHLGEGEVGRRGLAQVHALPGDGANAGGADALGQFAQDAGLADPGVTAQQHAAAGSAGPGGDRGAGGGVDRFGMGGFGGRGAGGGGTGGIGVIGGRGSRGTGVVVGPGAESVVGSVAGSVAGSYEDRPTGAAGSPTAPISRSSSF